MNNIYLNQNQNNTENLILFLSDFPEQTDEQDFREFFKEYNVLGIQINKTKEKKNFALLTLESLQLCDQVRQSKNLLPLKVNKLNNEGYYPLRISRYETKRNFTINFQVKN